MKHIPNLLTLTNLLLGCLAILYSFYDKLYISSFLIFAAAVIDFGDGFAARLLNAHSEIGKQLDSLADVTTFGVAPGFILYHLLAASFQQEVNSLEYPIIYFLPAFLIPVFSALRLAKFNIDENQNENFIGLPTPACAIFIASLPLIIFSNQFQLTNIILTKYFLYTTTALFSYLLVSPIKMFSLKFKNYDFSENKIRYLFLLASLILIVILKWIGIPLVIILYILFSLFTPNSKLKTQN